MPGYSGTPLVKKIGFKPGMRVTFSKAPTNWRAILGSLPDDVTVLGRSTGEVDLAVAFCVTLDDLSLAYSKYRPLLVPNGMLWIAWPKKASGMATELSDEIVRSLGIKARLVDVKVCAIDDVWSGLKFVIPVALRKST